MVSGLPHGCRVTWAEQVTTEGSQADGLTATTRARGAETSAGRQEPDSEQADAPQRKVRTTSVMPCALYTFHKAAFDVHVVRCMFSGRGAPEIDVLEYGIFPLPAWPSKELEGQQLPLFIHTLQMGPMLPPRTTWLPADLSDSSPRNLPPGLHMPGAGDPSRRTFLPSSLGKLSSPGFPRTGVWVLSPAYTAR